MKAQFTFLSGARAGEVAAFAKHYIGLGRHPLSDVRFDAERDLDVSARHAAIMHKADGFVVQDLNSKNGTFVNGRRVTGDVRLEDGDVIAFGEHGPSVEFRVVLGGDAPSAAAEAAAARASQPRDIVPAQSAAPRRSSTRVRQALEIARGRRTTRVLLALLVLTLAGAGYVLQRGSASRRELTALRVRADSLARAAASLVAQFQGRLTDLQDALAQSQSESARLRRALTDPSGDDATVARLRGELEAAEQRQRSLMGAAAVDYRSIAARNQDAVAMVMVEYTTGERYSGTAFAVDSGGVLVTNRHVLYGDDGTRVPRRLGVIFTGSKQVWQARVMATAEDADLALLKVDIRGGTPRVVGLVDDSAVPQRGDPVAIIGYPLGFDLPTNRVAAAPVAEPSLTAGTVSKLIDQVLQVDGYGAPGSSGSPIFDRAGRVVAVLYGGERATQGRLIYGVPARRVRQLLGDSRQVGARD